jgi:hypothetical protein
LARGQFLDRFCDRADAHVRLTLQIENEDLAVVGLTSSGCMDDGIYNDFGSIAWNCDLDLEHGQKLRRILERALDLGLSSLSIIFGFGHRKLMDSDPC